MIIGRRYQLFPFPLDFHSIYKTPRNHLSLTITTRPPNAHNTSNYHPRHILLNLLYPSSSPPFNTSTLPTRELPYIPRNVDPHTVPFTAQRDHVLTEARLFITDIGFVHRYVNGIACGCSFTAVLLLGFEVLRFCIVFELRLVLDK